jgi:hypothetical protein
MSARADLYDPTSTARRTAALSREAHRVVHRAEKVHAGAISALEEVSASGPRSDARAAARTPMSHLAAPSPRYPVRRRRGPVVAMEREVPAILVGVGSLALTAACVALALHGPSGGDPLSWVANGAVPSEGNGVVGVLLGSVATLVVVGVLAARRGLPLRTIRHGGR